jgi:ATP synthase I chain
VSVLIRGQAWLTPLLIEPTNASELDPAAESFYSGALPRISRAMIVVAVLLIGPVWLRFGWHIGAGFVAGCAIAYLNFYWLKRVVIALADGITQTGHRRSGKGIVLRFAVRYVLMALAAYGIFTVSPASLYGLFAGLFLPVAGIACEAAYEVYVAITRGL